MADVIHEPKFLRAGEASIRSNNNIGRMPFLLMRRFSHRRAPTRASGKQNSTSNDSVKCEEIVAEKHTCGTLTQPRGNAFHVAKHNGSKRKESKSTPRV